MKLNANSKIVEMITNKLIQLTEGKTKEEMIKAISEDINNDMIIIDDIMNRASVEENKQLFIISEIAKAINDQVDPKDIIIINDGDVVTKSSASNIPQTKADTELSSTYISEDPKKSFVSNINSMSKQELIDSFDQQDWVVFEKDNITPMSVYNKNISRDNVRCEYSKFNKIKFVNVRAKRLANFIKETI